VKTVNGTKCLENHQALGKIVVHVDIWLYTMVSELVQFLKFTKFTHQIWPKICL